MTRLTYSHQSDRQASLQKDNPVNEAEQILHFKRLLVTLKQHYEKRLHASKIQLEAEQNQRITLQKELQDLQILHEEELQSLREQQNVLKELIQKSQNECSSPSTINASSSEDNSNKLSEEKLSCLKKELEEAQQKLQSLEQELNKTQQNAHQEIEHLQELLAAEKEHRSGIETVVSPTSSHSLRREVEIIKRTLTQESKALETRYIEILNEKINLEQQNKQLKLHFEHQSSNLTAFQEQLHKLEEQKKILESALQQKETEEVESNHQREELQNQLTHLREDVKHNELIQERYEILKDEWIQMKEQLEEAMHLRTQVEHQLSQLEAVVANQEMQLKEFNQQFHTLQQEKQTLQTEREELKILLDESENRLKIAQQHLAKKVKETALLNEKLEIQQANLVESAQVIEQLKAQHAHLHASVDLYQKQEKRLQEQLQELLKGNETQLSKWEEKYFRMYDKWQESENRIRELKKFEEKHHQMQSLIANLGNFMGDPFNSFQPSSTQGEQLLPTDSSSTESAPSIIASEDKYDLFGMRQT